MAHADVFEVVFICTGNRARSALAEALYRKYTKGLPTTVSSAGTLDLGPQPALRDAVVAARRLDVDLSEHRSRSLRQTDLTTSDLILGFEPVHVSAAITEGDADPNRSFLLGELAMLLGAGNATDDAVAGARTALAEADSRRALHHSVTAAHVVGDPLGKPAKVMQRTASEIDELVQRIVHGLFGAAE